MLNSERLVQAVRVDNTSEVSSCLKAQVSPDTTDNRKTPVLVISIRHMALKASKLLLQAGAKSDATDRYGSAALHEAASIGSIKAIELLLSFSSKVDYVDKNGYTPLHRAVIKGNLKASELLINYGANINIKMKEDEYLGFNNLAPLHIASLNKNLDMVKLLVENGADLSTTTPEGETARDLFKRIAPDMLDDFDSVVTKAKEIYKGKLARGQEIGQELRSGDLRRQDNKESVSRLKALESEESSKGSTFLSFGIQPEGFGSSSLASAYHVAPVKNGMHKMSGAVDKFYSSPGKMVAKRDGSERGAFIQREVQIKRALSNPSRQAIVPFSAPVPSVYPMPYGVDFSGRTYTAPSVYVPSVGMPIVYYAQGVLPQYGVGGSRYVTNSNYRSL